MKYRPLGRTGYQISEVSFGAWAIGGTWGHVDDSESMKALHRALELGVNFFDTADVYGDGRSEKLLFRLRKETKTPFFVTTKAGRRVENHTADGYTKQNLAAFIERSAKNLGVETLDLLQLHCPPTDVYYRPEVFGALDELVKEGKLRFYGVSVERVEEALKAIEYPGVQSVQLIFNLFRQRPLDLFFGRAKEKKVGVLARLPLSSGMLTGKMTKATKFEKDDHRLFNRHGEGWDRGETFSGVDYELGLSVVDEMRPLVPAGFSLGDMALRWILDHDAVTATIPGAKRPDQVEQNVRPSDLAPLGDALHEKLRRIYEGKIRGQVHHYW
jgi:aryl-alcohol dehydrogenase-like predicted oxidoreductase